jgi:hypothetical protein
LIGRRLNFGDDERIGAPRVREFLEELVDRKVGVLLEKRAADLQPVGDDLDRMTLQKFGRQIGVAIGYDTNVGHGSRCSVWQTPTPVPQVRQSTVRLFGR